MTVVVLLAIMVLFHVFLLSINAGLNGRNARCRDRLSITRDMPQESFLKTTAVTLIPCMAVASSEALNRNADGT